VYVSSGGGVDAENQAGYEKTYNERGNTGMVSVFAAVGLKVGNCRIIRKFIVIGEQGCGNG
jgi:hypothetical protein